MREIYSTSKCSSVATEGCSCPVGSAGLGRPGKAEYVHGEAEHLDCAQSLPGKIVTCPGPCGSPHMDFDFHHLWLRIKLRSKTLFLRDSHTDNVHRKQDLQAKQRLPDMAARGAATSVLLAQLLLLSAALGQIVPVQPGRGSCSQRPTNCHIDCPHGYIWGIGATCLCICQLDPCLSKVCGSDESCVLEGSTPKCVPQLVAQKPTTHTAAMGECPTLVGGPCVEQCRVDSDCGGQMRCCKNGCGRECIIPITSHAIRSQLPIKSVPITKLSTPFAISMGKEDKLGHCPDLSTMRERRCVVECNKDSDCPSVAKCCNNGCGQLCTAPEKATACIHLLSAIERLPDQKLANDYVPTCTNDGRFDRIQCNSVYCWCVEQDSGREAHGTKVFREERHRMNCDDPRSCVEVDCPTQQCPYGFKTQQNGCPTSSCECRNICDDVRCENVLDACQLVEPDCANPPCLPVPRCLLNPCSNGLPMTLSNGVTALCTQSNQCSQNYWCHQIGYNGLGFCCPAPEAAARDGFCESRTPRHLKGCSSECRVDVDCKPTSKCCFDGCGLKCMEVNFSPNPFQYRPTAKITTTVDIAKSNKEVLSPLISECPEMTSSDEVSTCENKCNADADCSGMRRCCAYGCSRLCVYPAKTTPCVHQAITADLYSLHSVFACNSAGNFEETQCDDDRCFCVNVQNGIEIADTWVPLGNEPNCKDVRNPSCPINSCPEDCPHGYEKNGNGCPTCTCRNPCNEVHCAQGKVCILSEVECFQKSNCPPQPRCVLNFCAGQPYTSSNGLIAQCDSECPQGFWCNNVGIGGKGICCPAPEKMPRAGKCPRQAILLQDIASCKLDCRSDDDCQQGHKCCYDGCGTVCLQMEGELGRKSVPPSTETSSPNLPPNKIGLCAVPQGRGECGDRRNECVDDSDCPSIQKCCFDGCAKKCAFAQRTTACLHLKASLSQLGVGDTVKCTREGEFADVQCDKEYCWCVGRNGRETQGTRVSSGLTPNCASQRFCSSPICPSNKNCPYGFEKDSNGCDTCECSNPCRSVVCADYQMCVPYPVECLGSGPCVPVPRCTVNACPHGSPVIDSSTFEPVFCRESGQCQQGTYCRTFQSNGGYCCPQPEVDFSPGTCPRVVSSLLAANCRPKCKSDAQCGSNEKCCFDGCGLSCLAAEHKYPVHSAERKIGECSRVDDLGNAVCGADRIDRCENDSSCPSVQKCCFDGCAKTCQFATVSTLCLHMLASAERLREQGVGGTVQVQCNPDGSFVHVQQGNGLFYCVNNSGREIPGTRTTLGTPNCQQPRSCPLTACTKHCAFGYELTNQGCETCVCKDPCRGVVCPSNHVCRLSTVECFETECTSLPKCILNACPSGEPLERVDTRQLAECDDLHGKRCPNGWFCHKFGLEGMGYCCQGLGNLVSSTESCPSVPMLVSPRFSGCAIDCRLHSDCHGNGPCCFNGCGMSCRSGAPKPPPSTPIQKSVAIVSAIVPQNQVNVERLGVCPNNPISNPGCRSECTRDSECLDFQKCCAYGCGRVCQYPRVATACIHRLASYAALKTDSPSQHVQCTTDGLFRPVQCDQTIHQCWCVEPSSGLELAGTRITSLGKEPTCSVQRFCPTKCTEKPCDHGVKLDRTGCPLNGFCECRNPCDDFQCPKGDVCVLKSVECVSQPCPAVPTCQPNPCVGGLAVMKDPSGNAFICTRDSDCGRGQCRLLPGEHRSGICCPREAENAVFLSSMKIGECPKDVLLTTSECKNECESDSGCMGMDKCCQYGCSKLCVGPVNATNCIHLHAAIAMLKRSNIPTSLHKPQCDAHSGLFASTQCDDNNACWCADTVTGNEFHGTRTSQAMNVCTNRKACPISCEDRSTVCPFGLDLNKDGCARDSNCRCRNPCDYVQCPKGFTCLLRPRTCRDQTCLPYPTCERNPCVNNQKPAVEPRTFTQFTCLENRTHICPTGFYCTGYDTLRQGICCPGQEPILAQMSAQTMCPHGDAFSISPDGSPTQCSVDTNGCPTTHYCLSKPGESHGICCVTKRYVCNLEMDAGPCSASVPRFFYNFEKMACQPFTYGGCSGNLNNFGTEFECDHFCKGTGADPSSLLMDDYGHVLKDIYQMGFSLTGPLLRAKHHDDINSVFRSYVSKRFGVEESQIRDLIIRDDNAVKFSINTADAKTIAQNISDAVTARNFEFTYEGDVYRAEPHSWFSHQVSQNEPNNGNTFMFWVLLVASIIFALIIILSLCVACTFLQRRPKRGPGSTFRGSTASQQYVPNVSAYIQDNGDSSSSDSPTGSRDPSSQKVFSTDDFAGLNGQQSGSGFLQPHWSDTHLHHGAQTRGGRRPSRTTLYY
uniref:Thyroglobulin type-1 domain-containing protein n=1 Tax=Steinernema glaseri TaxID=37863 RepID=A0A1I8AEE0_9BILA